MVRIEIKEFRELISKMNLAIERSKINPKAGWIEIETIQGNRMSVKVANFDYYFESTIPITCNSDESIHVTVSSDTFVPLVSKLDDDYVIVSEGYNTLIFTTPTSEYTFPTIMELGLVKGVDKILFDKSQCKSAVTYGENLSSIAEQNAKGLVGVEFSKDIQRFIYFDELGAITFTDSIYINSFHPKSFSDGFKVLLNLTQAKLLKVFDSVENVSVFIDEENNKVMFEGSDGEITMSLVLVVQDEDTTIKFPCLRLREIADRVSQTHAIIDKKQFEKALSRLMVFDKKFDITVLNYSKLVFSEDSVKLVSIKNRNHETINYKECKNTSKHESIIRFADLVNQLKAVQGNEIDISYGDTPAIVINSGNFKQLIPEIQEINT